MEDQAGDIFAEFGPGEPFIEVHLVKLQMIDGFWTDVLTRVEGPSTGLTLSIEGSYSSREA
jgi:hypothetical protein